MRSRRMVASEKQDGWLAYEQAGEFPDAFTPDGCLWASDWPFLRAPARIDVGPLLTLVERFVPDRNDRRKVLWDTARRVLGFR